MLLVGCRSAIVADSRRRARGSFAARHCVLPHEVVRAHSFPHRKCSSSAAASSEAPAGSLPERRFFGWRWGPRSNAELLGLVLGAAVFPISAFLLNWYEDAKLARQSPPEIPGELVVVKKHELGGPFRLRSSKSGDYITDQELFTDKWTLLYFGFSKCAEVCPTTLQFLAEGLRRCDAEYADDEQLRQEVARLQVAFLSVDFLRDTPQEVEPFVSKYEPRIVGLCGSRKEVEQAAKAWRVYFSSYDESDEERAAREAKGLPEPVLDYTYQFDHSSAIYLVGPDGKMKDFFFKEMGHADLVTRLGVHMSDVYGFMDTRHSRE